MDKLTKGLLLLAAGATTWKAFKEVRQRKIEKDIYGSMVDMAEQHAEDQE